jgi:hypothetical protein
VDAVEAQIRRGPSRGFPDVPPDGIRLQAGEVGRRARRWDFFRGLEFWDDGLSTWVRGEEVSWDSQRRELNVPDLSGIHGYLRYSEHAPIYVRRAVEPMVYADPETDQPDPNLEYLNYESGIWVEGRHITAHTADELGPYHDTGPYWEAFDTAFDLGGRDPATGRMGIPGRAPAKPFEYFHTRPPSPDPEEASFYGARVLRGQDLVDYPQLTMGGWQVKGPDGRWHTIEEVYQDDPDEEEIELITGGWHEPHLDTSEELIVRPQQWDY